MTDTYKGSCFCGAVQVEVKGAPIKASQLVMEIKAREQCKFKTFEYSGKTAEQREEVGKQCLEQEIFMKGEDIIVLFAHGDLEVGLYEGRFQFKLP